MGQSTNERKSNKSGHHNYNAYIASPSTIQDPYWYIYSGASNHVTYDSNKCQELNEHEGKDSLTVGNDANLKILAFSTTAIHTHQRPLNLKDVIYVPKVTKNLLSVS
ncbi:hypothetical protein L6164_017093 [Bauhinia variegata]|uniref:Uncharacterized protein n=1 Tax=Bauhinia variegata TaxID=167791 RepID=A0ACB9N802_BAUVA|nr:hypothetical protein L6164_017093 [Bauhinia variegata]